MAKNKNSELEKISAQNKETVFGIDSVFDKEDRERLTSYGDRLKSIKKRISTFTGDNLVDFMNSAVFRGSNDKSSKDNKKNSNIRKDLESLIDENKDGVAEKLLSSEGGRILLYDNYEILINYIPKLNKAVNAIVDAILSPDNLVDNSLAFRYSDGVADTTIDRESGTVSNNLEIIRDKFNLDGVARKAIYTSLIYGDSYYAKLSLDNEFSKILTESQEDNPFYNNRLFEDNVDYELLTEDDMGILNEELSNYMKEELDVKYPNVKDLDWNEVFESLFSNIEFEEGPDALLKENHILNESLDKGINEFSKGKVNPKRSEDLASIITGKNKKDKKDIDVSVGGSSLKELDRKKVIKIYLDGVTYGYFYFIGGEPNLRPNNINTASGSLRHVYGYMHNSATNKMQSPDEITSDKLKKDIVLDLFVDKLSDKMNSKFLKNNSQFRDIIYNLMSLKYFTEKKVKVIYLAPDEVEHFYPAIGDDGYGISILKDALFLGTLYAATMMTTLTQKMIRSPQKRVFAIDVGYDRDFAGVINEFVKNIKTSDVKFHGGDISSVLRHIGKFEDIFIPTINGDTPIQIDTLDGLDTDADDEFLEYLLKEIIDSVGVPSAFIESVSEIDFARELSMQNANFVRRIISLQRTYSRPLTEMVRTLYKYEYSNDSRDGSLNEDYRFIEVVLPKPISLMLSTINDTISSVKDTMEFVVETYMGDNVSGDRAESVKNNFKKNLAKHYFPIIDWDLMDDIYEQSKIDTAETEATKGNDDDNDDGGHGSPWG